MVSFGQLRAAAIRAEKLEIEAKTFHLTKRKNNDKSGGSESKKVFNVASRGGSYLGSKSYEGKSEMIIGKDVHSTSSAPTCIHCSRNHFGECILLSRKCFRCGEIGHIVKYCPTPPEEVTVQQNRVSGFNTSMSRGRGRPDTGRGAGTGGSKTNKPQVQARVFAMT